MADEKKPGLIQKILQAGETALDSYIAKGKSELSADDDNAYYRKSLYLDPTYRTGASQGYHEKSSQLSYQYQSQMARRNTIVASIIQTFQNKIAAFAVVAKDKHSKGFKIKLKDEESKIQEIIEELYGNPDKTQDAKISDKDSKSEENRQIAIGNKQEMDFNKAENPEQMAEGAINPEDVLNEHGAEPQGAAEQDSQDPADHNKDGEVSEKEKRRIAKEELGKRTAEKISSLQQMVLHCGSLEDRPFESQRWDFDAMLRALVRDRLTFDQLAVEVVPDNSNNVHHWVPVDAGTIRYAAPTLKKYKDYSLDQGYDFLYPEKELEAMQEKDALELDEEKLDKEEYKFVQVINGRIVRAFTQEELVIGMANPTTDVFANGYSISELELLINMVSAHIFTENYNRSYFTQGFSAKGILHIKAPLNRRKLETIRAQWAHMVKGNRNSFQTPIMSGMDDIKWIPLTQSHSDMEFNNWMNYLIKIICGIYQIDPMEIGFGMKDEGGSGGNMNGDNSEQKMKASHTKGLEPMLRFLQKFINKHIVDRLDPDYELEFVGLTEESINETIARQEKEVKFKKSVNEIRAEDDLPPIAGADDLILDPTYMQWFTAFHPDGKKQAAENVAGAGIQGIQDQAGMDSQADDEFSSGGINDMQDGMSQDADQEDENVQGQVQDAEERNSQGEGQTGESVDSAIGAIQEQLSPPAPGKKPLKKSKTPLKKKKVQKVAIEYFTIRGK